MSDPVSKSTSEISKKVLVVEDEPGLRMIVESELTRAGYHVEAISSGVEAIAFLLRNRYDLAILDIALPGKSGIELLQFIRDRNMPTRVILLTTMEGLPAAIKAVRLGADDYVPRPFDAEYLLNAVRMVLRLKN